jgi:uncharacterized protein (UPF0264 family)
MSVATKLLVSVRLPAEVDAAIRGGADILDIKDPSRGALGRLPLEEMAAVVDVVPREIPLTAAWGELAEAATFCSRELEVLGRVAVVKMGTVGYRSLAHCSQAWREIQRALPAELKLAIVHYADWESAGSLDFDQSLELAIAAGEGPLVIDTCDKSRGNLLKFYPPEFLERLLEKTRRHGVPAVLAGSLRLEDLPLVLPCHPQVIAVRGAVCHQGQRGGIVSAERVAALRASLSQWHASQSSP